LKKNKNWKLVLLFVVIVYIFEAFFLFMKKTQEKNRTVSQIVKG